MVVCLSGNSNGGRTVDLAIFFEPLFIEECPRLRIIPHAFGERQGELTVLLLKFDAAPQPLTNTCLARRLCPSC